MARTKDLLKSYDTGLEGQGSPTDYYDALPK